MTDRDRQDLVFARLAQHTLSTLAEEAGLSLADAEGLLVRNDRGGSALDAPWWPEAVRRIQAGHSVRGVARSFATSPRRLRRGLARASVRTGGAAVPAEGLAALAPFRDRLGSEPDGDLAAAAGVAIEAVQGERRRLGVGPFKPAPGMAKRAASPPQSMEPVFRPAPRAEPAATVVRRAPPRSPSGGVLPPRTGLGPGLPRLARPAATPGAKPTRRRRVVRPSEDTEASE